MVGTGGGDMVGTGGEQASFRSLTVKSSQKDLQIDAKDGYI